MTLRSAIIPRRFSSAPVFGWTASLLSALALCLGCSTSTWAQLPGTVDPAFAPSVRTNGNVKYIATQTDGKQLVGGSFSQVGAATGSSLVRLNTDGTLDIGFVPPTGIGPVDYIVAQADGKVLVLYELTPDFSTNFKLVRLNADGSQDTSFSPPTFSGFPTSNELYTFVLAVQADDKVLVGGGFANDPNSSATVPTVLRYNADGSRDSTFQFPSTLRGQKVDSLLPLSNGQLLISGSFDAFNSSGNYVSYSLLRLNTDGSWDTTYPAGLGQNAGYDLTLQPDGKLLYLNDLISSEYPGGAPQRLNADGSVDASFAPQFSTKVSFSSLVLQPDGKVLLGGRTAVIDPPNGGFITSQSGVARVNADGSADATFKPVTPLVKNSVAALGLQPNGQILVGGYFLDFAGAERSSFGRLNSDGSLDPTYHNEITNVGTGYSVAVLPSGQPLLADSGVLVNGAVSTSLVSFNASGSVSVAFAASLDISQAFYDGNSIASTNALLAVQADGKPLLAGIFDPFYGYYVPTLHRYNADGSLDSTFSFEGTYGALNAVVPEADGHIYIAGQISLGYERYTYPVDRLNADGSLDGTFSPPADPAANGYRGSTIFALAVQPDGKIIVAGAFVKPYNGPQPPAVQRLNVDGSLDASFSTGLFTDDTYVVGAAGSVSTLALQPDGKVIVVGDFTSIGGVSVSGIARLNADGSLDTTFNTNLGATGIVSIAVQANGKILVGGYFASVNGAAFSGVLRLQPDGSIDPLFFPGTGIGETGDINSLALAPDGSVFVAGTFSDFSGQARDGFVRLFGGEVIAPVVTSGAAAAQVGQAFAYQLVAANNPTSFGAAGLPDGLSVSSTTGLISGTPTVAGTFTVTITAANPGGTGTATITITVAPLAPVITSAAASAQVGQAFSYQIAASGNPTSYGALHLPAGLSVDATTGLISGTPTDAGTFTLTLSATNAGGTGTATLTLTVSPALPVVTLTADIPQTTSGAGTYGEFTVTRTGGDFSTVLEVAYAIKGSATDGSDYVMLKGIRKIKAGKASAKIKVQPLGNGGGPGVKRVVTLVLESGTGYTVGTTGKVKVKIFGQ